MSVVLGWAHNGERRTGRPVYGLSDGDLICMLAVRVQSAYISFLDS